MLNLQNENIVFIFPIVEDFVSKVRLMFCVCDIVSVSTTAFTYILIFFCAQHGRGVYLRPIYTTLIKLAKEEKVPLADVKRIYNNNKTFYHSVITNMFSKHLAQ